MTTDAKPRLPVACLRPEAFKNPPPSWGYMRIHLPRALFSFDIDAAEASKMCPPLLHWTLIKRQDGIQRNSRLHVALSKGVSFEIFNILNLI